MLKYTTFNTEIKEKNCIQIPVEVQERLGLAPGMMVQVSIKKIRAKRIDLLIKENPLYRLIHLAEEEESQ
jgi:bifunctional DNA-binding transcriptional regulator/antitoxin component of YhaV-PrlF toxin-antitoxin module